jgi:pilus assembly protein Flp/PilA
MDQTEACQLTGRTAMTALLRRFVRNEGAATAIEYGLIAGLIAVAIITGLTGISSGMNTNFNTIVTKLMP